MEKIPELLLNLEREDAVKNKMMQERCSVLERYKLEALKCEQKLKENERQKHKQLLKKVSIIENDLRAKHQDRDAGQISTSTCKNEKHHPKHIFHDDAIDEVNLTSNQIKESHNNVYKNKQENEVIADDALVESFSKLEDLQSQQKNLENWYLQMTEQLQLEQCRLTEKFDDMRLKILQKKQYYLQSSQEYISNISRESAHYDKKQNNQGSQENDTAGGYEANSEKFSSPKVSQKPFDKYPVQGLDSPELEPVRDVEMYHGRKDNVHQMNQSTTPLTFSQRQNVNIPSGTENSPGERHLTNQRLISESSMHESNELVDKTLLISPIHVSKSSTTSLQTMNTSSNKSVKTDLLHRYAMVASPYKGGSSRGSPLTHKANIYSNLSHSTPVRGLEYVKSMSDTQLTQQDLYASVSDPSLKMSFDRLGAVAVGYLTRKLMRTEKVQALIKTIKDTKTVLAGLEKDTSFTNKHSAARVEQQLKANVHQELVNAQTKLYNMLLNSTSTERIEVISKSRVAAANRENQLYYKNKAKSSLSTSLHSKRLSAATQKTIRRKQEHPLNQRSISRPNTSPAGKTLAEGKKQRKAWDIRSLKPTQSEGSPLYSERNKNVIAESQTQEANVKHAEDVTAVHSKDVPNKRKTARKRPLAVTLSRKTNAT